MGAKHMQSNSSMVGKISKSNKMLSRAVDRPSKEPQQLSSKDLPAAFPNKLDPIASTRVACCRNRRSCTCKSCIEYGRHNEISLKLVQKNEAAEPFSSRKFVGVADKQCKQLLDALGIFNANKELFVNLLQDPNSLLIKRIEDSADSRTKKPQMRTFFDSRLSANKIREAGGYEEPAESDDSLSLERIVVLKPNLTSSLHADMGTDSCSSLESHSSLIKNVQCDKGTLFSFRQIKRKMKQAMGVGRKEDEYQSTNDISKKTQDDGKQMVMEATGSCNSNIQTDDKGISSFFQDFLKRDQLNKTFYSRNGDKTASTSESTSKKDQSAFTGNLKRQKSKEVSRKTKAKPWGWVTCFSDDDILTPSNENGCHSAGHMRYSHLSKKKFIHEKKSKPQNDEKHRCETPQIAKIETSSAETRRGDEQLHRSNSELNVSHDVFPDVKVDEEPTIEGSMVIVKDIATVYQEGNNFSEASSGFDNSCNTSFCQRTVKINGFGEKGSPELSKRNLALEAQSPEFEVDTSSSSLSRCQSVEDPNGSCDKEAHSLSETSHIVDDASSNLVFSPRTAESTGLVRLQEALNPAITTSNCCCSVSKYVFELLQFSKQNWNELSVDCHSSAWLLIPFVDKVKLFGSQLCSDCVLVFDYFNEVLEDVFKCCIRCSPWLCSYKSHIQTPPNKDGAFCHEVMQHVDLSLLQQQQPPQTLDSLCLRDLRSRTWIDYSIETEEVVTIMAESVLRELIIESVVYLGL